ncbi:MAG TPA: thioredoxin domain-containing protein [Chthoniobacterales bacterium]
MKRYLPFVIIILVAVATVSAGVFLYHKKVAELTPKAVAAGESKAGAAEVHVRGPQKAPVTLEEFGDFQCPPCGTLSSVLPRIEHDFGDQLRVIFRNFPLAVHSHAAEAARAAEAAGMQGKFWEMHDTLFHNQNVWSKEADVKPTFLNYAREIGLDATRFERDYDGEEPRTRVTADQARGTSLGVTSTPTLFINDQPLPPTSLNETALRAAIAAAARGEAIPTATPTVAPIAVPLAPVAPTAQPSQP